MLCPTCHHNFLALVACDDRVHRCGSCKAARPPAPAGPTRSRYVKYLRRRDGFCITCGAPAEDGKLYCAEHIAVNAKRAAILREAAK